MDVELVSFRNNDDILVLTERFFKICRYRVFLIKNNKFYGQFSMNYTERESRANS